MVKIYYKVIDPTSVVGQIAVTYKQFSVSYGGALYVGEEWEYILVHCIQMIKS